MMNYHFEAGKFQTAGQLVESFASRLRLPIDIDALRAVATEIEGKYDDMAEPQRSLLYRRLAVTQLAKTLQRQTTEALKRVSQAQREMVSRHLKAVLGSGEDESLNLDPSRWLDGLEVESPDLGLHVLAVFTYMILMQQETLDA